MKKLALALSIVVLMCGCKSNSSSPTVFVYVTPNAPPSIDQGQSLHFTATLTGDSSNQGVTWSATGTACSGVACGTFSNITGTTATYIAPVSVSGNLAVTVTATSVAASTQNAMATFNVEPLPTVVTTNLPNATPNYIYYITLAGAGGVQPLKWSIASGSLPAGLSLNSAGTIYGTPTTGGTSNFTVKVTDSSGAPAGAVSIEQTFSLTVVSVLTVPSALLPSGTVGTAYTATLSLTGGIPPFNWAIYSGNLPAGLVLQSNTGVISGVPTVEGTTSFVVEAFDSSPTQQSYISSNFSITINASGPLNLRTTSLLDGTVGAPYEGQLVSTGGTPPFNWTVTAGTLPTGLVLSPTTGAISGIPNGSPGNSPFTVEVSDASTPQQTSIQPLSITINSSVAACTSTGNDSILVGQYAFNLRGFNGTGFLAVVGSFTADGNGHITAGGADTNGVLGAQNGSLVPSASSYSVGPDNRGCATLATPFGTFYTRFAVGDLSAGVSTQGRIIEFDTPSTSAYIASGLILQQNPSAFLFPLTGSYALRTSGWDSSTSGRIACVGLVTGTKYQFSFLEQDCNDNGTVSNTTNVSNPANTQVNTYTTADANGRGTGLLSVGQTTSGLTFYWVSSNELFIVNSDPIITFAGDWVPVAVPLGSSAFNQSSFNNNVAAYASGLGLAGVGGGVSISTETADGSSSVSAHLYRDEAGAWHDSTPTCTYAIVGIGRMTLSGSGCEPAPPIYYLNGLNSAYQVGTDAAIELGSFEPQTTGLTTAAMAGTYFLGTSEVVSQDAQAEVGILTLGSNGNLTSITDTASTLSQTADTAGSDSLTLNSDGSFSTTSSGGITVGVAISASKFVITSTPTLTFPTLLVGQQ